MWVVGDGTGLSIPGDVAALRDGGTRFLSTAFRRFGTLAAENAVVDITECAEVDGGSTGRKALLSVAYRHPGQCEALFVKFSRDLDDPARDEGRTQMGPEVAFCAISAHADFPVTVPRTLFADYHRDSGTGLLISERIPFGCNGIEPQHPKCADYLMPDQLDHYRALLTSIARLAGADRRGTIPPLDLTDPNVSPASRRPSPNADRLRRRIDRLTDFAAACPGLLPANVRAAPFLSGLRSELPTLLAAEELVWRELGRHPQLHALCHWNANVDNAWFWRDAAGALQCGLLDWGGVGRMNLAMAVWGAMCSAETALWNEHLDDLLVAFVTEFERCGGGPIDVDLLTRHVLLYASVMGMTWLLDVPSRVRSTVPGLDATTTRMDAPIRDVEAVRCPLQMMVNVLNLWETRGLARVLHGV